MDPVVKAMFRSPSMANEAVTPPVVGSVKIEMYGIIGPGPLLYLAAIALPWIELLCAAALLTGIFMRGSALILASINFVFIIVIAYRTAGIMSAEGTPLRDVYFDCGCGFGATYAWKKLIEDTVFLVFSVAILFSPTYRFVIGRKKG